MKQIRYHPTHPHHKTVVRPNDNAVGNPWRKGVWGNPVAARSSWALGGQESITGAGESFPQGPQAQTAGSALAGQGAQQMTHEPQSFFNNACEELLWLPSYKLHRFSCAFSSGDNWILTKVILPPT